MSDPASVLIVGGTSDIGRAVAGRFAASGWQVVLAGRSEAGLRREAADIGIRSSSTLEWRIVDLADLPATVAFAEALTPLPDVVVVAAGVMTDPAAQPDPRSAAEAMAVNLTGPALLLSAFGRRFAVRGSGSLVGISSVAGDRGRAKNMIYGASKAGFTAALSGIRQHLSGSGVHVLTVKPGFVRTKMTAGMDLPPRLTASPERVARDIHRAILHRRDVIYTPPVWGAVMAVIRLLPEAVFRRTSI